MIRTLERSGDLNRALEHLPSEEEIAERRIAGEGLTRPEIAIVLSYGKIWAYKALIQSDVPEDAYLSEEMLRYFPRAVQRRFAELGVPFVRAAVGDRYVLEALEQRGWLFGGESSGHLLCLDRHTTGDGIISALQVLAASRRLGSSIAGLTAELEMMSQTMVNVRVQAGFHWQSHQPLVQELSRAQGDLEGKGRVLIRPSGTEPLLRIMVEAADPGFARSLADRLAATVG